jgi:hypothetical protein
VLFAREVARPGAHPRRHRTLEPAAVTRQARNLTRNIEDRIDRF